MNRGKAALLAAAGVLVIGLTAYLMVRWGTPDYAPRGVPPTLEQETRRLEAELPLAASRKPYLVVDLLSSNLVYRISGMSPKTIPFQIASVRDRLGRRELSPEGQSLLVLEERGAPREVIKPPNPDEPLDPLKDPKIFPPDPPTSYTLTFEGSATVEILGEKESGWKERVTSLGKGIRQWLRRGHEKGKLRVRIRLPAPRAQEIYRALYRGEKVLLLGVEGGAPAAEAGVSGG
jgi:hypothetical protein